MNQIGSREIIVTLETVTIFSQNDRFLVNYLPELLVSVYMENRNFLSHKLQMKKKLNEIEMPTTHTFSTD